MNKKALFSFFVSFLLLIAVIIIDRNAFRDMKEYVVQVDRTREVIISFEKLSNYFKSLQIYSPTYATITDAEFYTLYKAETDSIYPVLDYLKNATSDNPEQSRRMDTISSLIGTHYDALRRKNIVELIQSGETWRLKELFMIHAVINRAIAFEQELLAGREEKLVTSSRLTSTLTIIFSLIAAAIIISVFISNVFLARKGSRYEEDLKANIRKLEASNVELEQYAYAASHDLQEPLRKIRMYASRLRDKHLRHLDEAGKQDLEKVIAGAERMSSLITDILTFSSVKHTDTFSKINLDHTLQNVLEDLEVLIDQTGAVIEKDPLPELEAIPLQMNQLFYNLLNNALKFTYDGRKPVIRITSHSLSSKELTRYPKLKKTGKYHEITFSDNGMGFSQEYAEHIFGMFKRLGDKSQYPGSGIGLALCRKVVENHNGHIYALSKEGEGATFVIILPQNHV